MRENAARAVGSVGAARTPPGSGAGSRHHSEGMDQRWASRLPSLAPSCPGLETVLAGGTQLSHHCHYREEQSHWYGVAARANHSYGTLK